MSAAWSISHPLRLVVIVAKGESDQTDFSRLGDSIDRANAAGYQNIVDITGVRSAPPPRSLHEFAAIVRARSRAYCGTDRHRRQVGGGGALRQCLCPAGEGPKVDQRLSRSMRGAPMAWQLLRLRKGRHGIHTAPRGGLGRSERASIPRRYVVCLTLTGASIRAWGNSRKAGRVDGPGCGMTWSLDFADLSRRLRGLAESTRSIARVAPNLADKQRLFRNAEQLDAQADRLDAPASLSQVKGPPPKKDWP